MVTGRAGLGVERLEGRLNLSGIPVGEVVPISATVQASTQNASQKVTPLIPLTTAVSDAVKAGASTITASTPVSLDPTATVTTRSRPSRKLAPATTAPQTKVLPASLPTTTTNTTTTTVKTPVIKTPGVVGPDMVAIDNAYINRQLSNLHADGKQNDLATIQALVAATPEGGTLTLPPGKTFLLYEALKLPKPITVDLNGSTLALRHATSLPTNDVVIIRSAYSQMLNWNETIKEGATELSISTSAQTGSTVYMALGVSPHDPNEPHWTGFVKILENDGQHIKIDKAIPLDINGSKHTLKVVSSLARDVTLRNGTLQSLSIDGGHMAGIWAEECQNVLFEDLTIIGQGILIDHIENVTGRNLVIKNRFIHEHGVMGWDIKNAVFDGVDWTAGTMLRPDSNRPRPQFAGAEGFTTSFSITNATLRSSKEMLLFASQEDSFIHFGKVKVVAPKLEFHADGAHFDELDVEGELLYAGTSIVDKLTLNGQQFADTVIWETTVPLLSLTQSRKLDLPTGMFTKFEVFMDGAVGGQIYICNDGGKIYNVLDGGVRAGQWSTIEVGTNTGSVFGLGEVNNPAHLKRWMVGDGNGDPNQLVKIRVTYFQTTN